MTDQQAAHDDNDGVGVDTDEPMGDEGQADAVILVRTGWVRLRFGDRQVRMRRPFFGELRSIRARLEDVADAIGERAEDSQVIAVRIMDESARIEADEKLTVEERVRARRALLGESKVAGRELTEFAEIERVKWWRYVVDLIGVDGELPPDEELPSWIAAPALPGKVLDHWRSAPLGRGGR